MYQDDSVKVYVVRDKNYKELNVCHDKRVADAYCAYYNELETMKGCTVEVEKRRNDQ